MSIKGLTVFIYGLAMILNKDLGIRNIYLSGVLMTAPKILGHAGMSFIIPHFRIRSLILFMISCVLGLGIVLLAMNLTSNWFVAYPDRSDVYRVAESGNLTSDWNYHRDCRRLLVRCGVYVHD